MPPMPKVALAFFTVAPIYVLIGMGWGMIMGATEDHLMAPAQAHLNLLGFVGSAIVGTFYALAQGRYSIRLAWIHFWVANLAIVLMIPSLAMILAGHQTPSVMVTIGASEIMAFSGMLLFLLVVLGVWKRRDA